MAQHLLESKLCPMGCPANDEKLFEGHDRLHSLPGNFTVVRCQTCGLMRTNPRPTPDTIGFYYPEDYGPYQSTKVLFEQKAVKSRPLWKRIFLKFYETNTTPLPVLKPGQLLEIGCASGLFLHQMAQEGWSVTGIEFSEKAAENARALGYPVYTGQLETAPDPQQLYDLVAGWMVFEHLHDPVLVLKKLYKWTKPDGWLVISVPNAESFEFQLFKDSWYALQLPAHLYHYTPETLQNVLNQGGWKISKLFHQRVLGNLIASIGYKLSDMGFRNNFTKALADFPAKPTKIRFLLYPLAYLLGIFGQTGRMTVWARKK